MAGMSETEFSGYTVSYGGGEAHFPVYVVGFLAAILLAAAFFNGSTVIFLLGFAASGFAYYNFPLLETGRPRLGANQYGIFIEAFGLIRWRAIARIDLVPIAVRAMTVNELQIALNQPLGSALVADWRRVPFYRQGMRPTWSMTYDNVIRIKLDPFDREPGEIHRTLLRMWRYYRS